MTFLFVSLFKCKILSVKFYQGNNGPKFNNKQFFGFWFFGGEFSKTTASGGKSAVIDLIHENTRVVTKVAAIAFETEPSLKKEHARLGAEETTGKK